VLLPWSMCAIIEKFLMFKRSTISILDSIDDHPIQNPGSIITSADPKSKIK